MRRTRLVTEEAILLCRCATSSEPAECFRQTRWQERTLLNHDILELCSPTLKRGLLPNCLPATAPYR